MPTPSEQRALLFVATLAALGMGVRGISALFRPDPPASDRAQLAAQLAAVDSALSAGGKRRGGTSPSAPPRATLPPRVTLPPRATRSAELAPDQAAPTVDMDAATAADLERLPGIGPALAARIVTDRDSLGPFGSLDGLQRVRGIGPALAGRLAGRVTFSLPPRHMRTEVPSRGRARRP